MFRRYQHELQQDCASAKPEHTKLFWSTVQHSTSELSSELSSTSACWKSSVLLPQPQLHPHCCSQLSGHAHDPKDVQLPLPHLLFLPEQQAHGAGLAHVDLPQDLERDDLPAAHDEPLPLPHDHQLLLALHCPANFKIIPKTWLRDSSQGRGVVTVHKDEIKLWTTESYRAKSDAEHSQHGQSFLKKRSRQEAASIEERTYVIQLKDPPSFCSNAYVQGFLRIPLRQSTDLTLRKEFS